MTQDEIRKFLGSKPGVVTQVATEGDGSPEIAWGDTFFYISDKNGEPKKMPFATIVTKDYVGFDSDSNLNRGGMYRLNIEVGREKFEALFGFKPNEFAAHRSNFDFTSLNQLFPHPLYGTHGWISMINPQADTQIQPLLEFSLQQALQRIST